MKFVNVRTVKAKLSEYLNSGEQIIITKWGIPFALLTPLTEEDVKKLGDKGVEGMREEVE